MKAKPIYLCLALAGAIIPGWQLARFVHDHGLDLALLVEQLFATHASAFFALDVIVSTLVLWTFIAIDRRGARTPHLWAPILASLLVGVSLALPLFLYLRESRREGSGQPS